METIQNWCQRTWGTFSDRHPTAAKWLREGGMFMIFNYLMTFLKYLMLLFLPGMFAAYKDIGWGWPSIPLHLFGIDFTFNVIGYAVADGGLAYLIAYLIANILAEVINFPLQRRYTFRSDGPLYLQIPIYAVGWVIITLIVNSCNSLWVGLAGGLGVSPALYNIVTTVLNGGVSMVVFFIVDKIIFAPDFGKAIDHSIIEEGK